MPLRVRRRRVEALRRDVLGYGSGVFATKPLHPSRNIYMLGAESPSRSASYRAVVKRKRDAVLVHERERRFSFWALAGNRRRTTGGDMYGFRMAQLPAPEYTLLQRLRNDVLGGCTQRVAIATALRVTAEVVREGGRGPTGGGALQRVQIGGTERAAG